jgi:hypothetical protein
MFSSLYLHRTPRKKEKNALATRKIKKEPTTRGKKKRQHPRPRKR